MMNYTETFQEFATRMKPVDLALYAGVGIVLWVLFRDKLSPVQKILGDLLNKVKTNLDKSPSTISVIKPVEVSVQQDTFFKLVVSWKQTRDLAVESGCDEAVKVADQMFPYLSPNVCGKEKV